MFFCVIVQDIDLLRRKKIWEKNINCTYAIDDMKLRYSKLVLFDTERFVLPQFV